MSSNGGPNGTGSGPARKRPRLLEEAVEAGDGVAVKFADSFALDNRNLVLLQVPESLLDELGEDADLGLVKLIGSEGQDAVLVTGGQTFKLTKAETSNTLLLLPPEGTCGGDSGSGGSGGGGSDVVAGTGGEGGFEAVAAVGFQYEISKATPSLEQIRSILGACMYRGKENEASIDRERLAACALEKLQTRVQSSHRELLEGLQKLEALSIKGHWRMIEPVLMERTADQLLSAIVEHDMPLERVDAEGCVTALPQCEPLVLEHCLRTYSLAAGSGQASASGSGAIESGGSSEDAGATAGHYRLDSDKVARLRAHQILRAHEAEADAENDGPLSLCLSDFEERWAAAMPGVDTPSQDLLKGIALVERKTGADGKAGAAAVSYVPASGLPFAPAERLAALFRIKAKWPMGELEPYISETDRKAGFLLKNTRFSTDPATGLKLFSAR